MGLLSMTDSIYWFRNMAPIGRTIVILVWGAVAVAEMLNFHVLLWQHDRIQHSALYLPHMVIWFPYNNTRYT
jgi:hypothetical protein